MVREAQFIRLRSGKIEPTIVKAIEKESIALELRKNGTG
jgi:hypothetical protein